MPNKCFVKGCPSNRMAPKEKIHLFSVPSDSEMFKKWRNAIGSTKDKRMTKFSKICYKHFADDAIIKSTTVSLPDGSVYFQPITQWRLKPGSIPNKYDAQQYGMAPESSTQFGGKVITAAITMPLTDPVTSMSSGGPVNDIEMKSANPDVYTSMTSFGCHPGFKEFESPSLPENVNAEVFSELITADVQQCGLQHESFEELDGQVNAVMKPLTEADTSTYWKNRAKRFQKLYNKWKTKFQRLKKKYGNSHRGEPRDGVFIPYLNLSFREKMFANALARKSNTRSMRYSNTHMMEALLLSCKGKRHYNFIRENDIQVLPSLRTVQKLKRGLSDSKTGLNMDVLAMMKELFKDLDEKDRYVSIKFDEIYLDIGLREQGAQGNYKVDGIDVNNKPLEKRLQDRSMLIMAESLKDKGIYTVANYPTAGGLKSKEIAEILKEVITAVEEHGGAVIAITSDGAQANKSCYRQFGIQVDKGVVQKYWIPNPHCPSRCIYFLHDPPHLIKCIRNYFLRDDITHHFMGKFISAAYLHRLLWLDEKNPMHRVCPKLTIDHLKNDESYMKMKVCLASQLLSKSTAHGIKYYRELGDEEMKGSEATELFILYVNDMFDSLNATSPKNAVREGEHNLLETMRRSYRLFLNPLKSTFASPTTMASLQLTLKSTIDICTFLFDKGYKYVLTGKLNQDVVEIRFSAVRGYSPNDHPDVNQFSDINAVKALCGPLSHVLSEKSNVKNLNIKVADKDRNEYCDKVISNLKKKGKMIQEKAKKNFTELSEVVKNNSIVLEDYDIENRESGNSSQISPQNVVDDALYRICGYVLNQVRRQIKCKQCLEKLYHEDSGGTGGGTVPSKLVDIKEFERKGLNQPLTQPTPLTRASTDFFLICKTVDVQAKTYLTTENMKPDILTEIAKKLCPIISWTGLFCSRDHADRFLPIIVIAFLHKRLRHFVKLIRDKNSRNRKLKCAKRNCKLRL